ncbi:MAG TPA: TlpA disulfide reductase family protein [Anaerolineae bacterium]|nr:TlpA disulfide reductase family protein [Anaerolineae bacterium]HOR01282.1 TlpA disulfide reductase family protein [Anaerolineae bacterium]
MAQVRDLNADGHALAYGAGFRVETLLLLLMGITILLMLAIVGLFVRMNQLQTQVLAALQSVQGANSPDAWQREALQPGEMAPAFSLPDMTGAAVSLQEFAGRRVLLAFTSPSCPGCVQALPALRAFSEKHQDVQVLVVMQGTEEDTRKLIEEQQLDLTVVRGDAKTAASFKVRGVPFFYFVGETGHIIGSGFANTVEQLEGIVSAGKQ